MDDDDFRDVPEEEPDWYPTDAEQLAEVGMSWKEF